MNDQNLNKGLPKWGSVPRNSDRTGSDRRNCEMMLDDSRISFASLKRLAELDRQPDFYLTAGPELDLLEEMRACWTIDRLRDSRRDDYMLVQISPVLIGQPFGLGGKDISQLILSSRHVGQSLFPVTEWPSYVYIARIIDVSILTTKVFGPDQVEYIAKATIYRTRGIS